jgi:hypothetical protein
MFNVVTTVAGDTGEGKTTSMRNLGKNAILYNVEQKALPFPTKQNQIFDKKITHPNEMFFHLPKIMIRPDMDTICLDSFSHTVNYFKFKTEFEDLKKGFDIYKGYNGMIFAMFELFKKLMNKYVFILAHAEKFDQPDGSKKSFIKVDGKVYENTVEQFAIVALVAKKVKYTDETGKPKAKHIFEYEGFDNSVKAPMEMFSGELDNDLNLVVNRYKTFWKLPSSDEVVMMYLNEKHTAELLRRMEEMKAFYKGPLNLDPLSVDRAFDEAYASIPEIMEKIVLPTAQRVQGGLSNVHPTATVPTQTATPTPAAEVKPQVAQASPSPAPASPAPQAVVPSGPAPGIPQPGQSLSAIDQLAQSI